MEAVFQQEIANDKARGRTVLLSSHIMSEVEALADRVSIIRSGRVVQTGSLDELRGQTRATITATLGRPPRDLRELRGIRYPRLDGNRFTATVDNGQINAAMADLVRYDMTNLTVTPPSLEDLFLQQYTTTGQP